jgi:hypothetical protein
VNGSVKTRWIAPVAVGVAAFCWLLSGSFLAWFVRPTWDPAMNTWWSLIDPVSPAQARELWTQAILVFAAGVVGSGVHVAIGLGYSSRRSARRITIFLGAGYALLGAVCLAKWLSDRTAPALLLYAALAILLAVPMLDAIRSERRIQRA